MSQYFEVNGQTVWNPANGVAAVFLGSAAMAAEELGVPSGIGPVISDECEIELAVFEVFADALVRRFRACSHAVLRELLAGVTAVVVVLVQRAGGVLPALSEQAEDELTRAQLARLRALAVEMDRSMAW